MKIYKKTLFDVCVISKSEDNATTTKYLSKEDKKRNADFYAIFLKPKTGELIGKAAMSCYWKKKKRFCREQYNQATIALYDFPDNMSQKLIKNILMWIIDYSCSVVTHYIILNVTDAPAFKNREKYIKQKICTSEIIPEDETNYFVWLGNRYNFIMVSTFFASIFILLIAIAFLLYSFLITKNLLG